MDDFNDDDMFIVVFMTIIPIIKLYYIISTLNGTES